ncbi:hypothetical protein ACFVAV_06135 [Nocardia sp. NPDC057663]
MDFDCEPSAITYCEHVGAAVTELLFDFSDRAGLAQLVSDPVLASLVQK